MLDWLLAPIDPSRAHDVAAMVSWHGRTMTLAWGGLVPLGILAARFFKRLPRQEKEKTVENLVWWKLHQSAQYSALALTAIGVALILASREPVASLTLRVMLHHWLGWAIVTLAALQLVSGLLRGTKGGPTDQKGNLRGDHYDMTPRRILFEWVHKGVGYSVLFLAAVTILTGLWQANAPNWMWASVLGWWGLLLLLAVLLTRRGMVLDTYHAIWGTGPDHPGNRPTSRAGANRSRIRQRQMR